MTAGEENIEGGEAEPLGREIKDKQQRSSRTLAKKNVRSKNREGSRVGNEEQKF